MVITMAEILLENVTHKYRGDYAAVADVNLKFRDGSFSCLLGPSGCGKTTLMRIIAGLLTPTEGKILFDGKNVTELPPEKRNTAMVFQYPVIYDMKVFDNLAFPLRNIKMAENEIRRKVEKLADLLGITGYLHLRAATLDSGIKQKVALGRALVREPNVYLLDEPLSNIDPKDRFEIKTKLKQLQREIKSTAIYVTHDQTEALTLGEEIAVMNFGKVLQYDAPKTLYERPATEFVASFVGNPGMNLLPCVLSGNSLDLGGLKHDASNLMERIEQQQGKGLILGIRPEDIRISREKTAGSNPFRCTRSENVGVAQILYLESNNTRAPLHITAKIEDTAPVPKGESLWVNFPGDKTRIFNRTGELLI